MGIHIERKMKLFALLAVAAVQARQVNTFAEGDLNDVCTAEGTCTDENAECKEAPASFRDGDKKCLCKDTFVEDSNKVCQCGEGFLPNDDDTACEADPETEPTEVPPGPGLGDACENNDSCTGDGQICSKEEL